MKKTRKSYKKTSSKYKNKKVIYQGMKFDSIKEAHRYSELVLMQKAGEITNLERQVRIELLPSQKDTVQYFDKKMRIKYKQIVIERPVFYIADFVYMDKYGNTVHEDTKGLKTADYIIKRKLALYLKNIRIKEL